MGMKFKILLITILTGTLYSCSYQLPMVIDLSGEWQFQIDALDEGIAQEWYNKNLTETIQLPGSMAESGKGNDISVETQWTGNMWNDSLWYTSPKMSKYREPG